jgi:hypothetical protein
LIFFPCCKSVATPNFSPTEFRNTEVFGFQERRGKRIPFLFQGGKAFPTPFGGKEKEQRN